MTKRKAIEILKNQINKLNNCDHIGHHWLATLSLVELIFGKDSVEYQGIGSLRTTNLKLEEYRESMAPILRTYIDIVENKGVHKNGNFLSRMSEGWLIVCITVIIPTVFGIGYWVKSYEKSVDQQDKTNTTTEVMLPK